MWSATTDSRYSQALERLRKVKRKHHGRDPNGGLDCIGLILTVYRMAGKPIDHLDRPYSERDAQRPGRLRQIMERLLEAFDPIPCIPTCDTLIDGDVVIFYRSHLGIVADGKVWHMAERLESIPLWRVAPFISTVFRYRDH